MRIAVINFFQRKVGAIDALARELLQIDDKIFGIKTYHFREYMILIDDDSLHFRHAFYPVGIDIEIFSWVNRVLIFQYRNQVIQHHKSLLNRMLKFSHPYYTS